MIRLLASLVLLSAVSGDPASCQNQVISLVDNHETFIFNRTEMAGNQKCQWNFTFPSNMVAEISINGSSLTFSDSIKLLSIWGTENSQFLEIQGDRNATVDKSLHVMWPPTGFEMTINTGANTSAILAIKVQIVNYYISSTPVTKYTTAVNQQPKFVQFDSNYDWNRYSRVQATAANNGKVVASVDNPGPWDYVTYANIFVYSGNGSNLVFLGTINSLLNNAYNDHIISPNDILTLYKAMDTPVTATLILNDHENLKNVGEFDLDWSPKADRNYVGWHQLDATWAPAALTVLNEVATSGGGFSNAIYLTRVEYLYCFTCPGATNHTSPVKVLAGGMVRDYDTQGTLLGTYRDPTVVDDKNYPQYLPGGARTFVLEQGIAIIHYTSVQPAEDTEDINGRNGFLKSNNYPFLVWGQSSSNLTINSMDGSNFTLEYTILTQFTTTYYLNVYTTYNNHTTTKQTDLRNVAPGSYNVTAQGVGLCLVQSMDTINGTLIPYKIYSSFNPVTTGPEKTTTIQPVITSTSPAPVTTGVSVTTGQTTVKPISTTMSSGGNGSTTASPVTNTTTGSTATTGKPVTTTMSPIGNGTTTSTTARSPVTTTTGKPITTTMASSGNGTSTIVPPVTNATTATSGATTLKPVNVTTPASTSSTTTILPVITTTPVKHTTTSPSKSTTSTLPPVRTTSSPLTSTIDPSMTTNSPIETSTAIDTTTIQPGNGTIPTNSTIPTVQTIPTTTPKAAYSNFGLTAVIASLIFLIVG